MKETVNPSFVLGLVIISLLVSFVRVMVAVYLTNEIFEKPIINFTAGNIFYVWCVYCILTVKFKFELKAD